MAFILRVGALNLPAAGDHIAVYKTGTLDLVIGLKTPDTAALDLDNPFIVPASGDYGFEPPNTDRVDIFWVEQSANIVEDVNVRDITKDLKSGAFAEALVLSEDDPIMDGIADPGDSEEVSKANHIHPIAIYPTTRVLYVDKSGDDTTGTGSAVNPLLTISNAIVIAKDLTIPPSTANPVTIVFLGKYNEQVIIENQGINLFGLGGQFQSEIYFNGNALILRDNGVDPEPWDFKSHNISYRSTNVAEYAVKIEGIAGSSLLGNEGKFIFGAIHGPKSLHSNIANYIDLDNTYVMGEIKCQQTSGLWLERNQVNVAPIIDWDPAGAKPSDDSHYGVFFMGGFSPDPVLVNGGLLGEDLRVKHFRTNEIANDSDVSGATDTDALNNLQTQVNKSDVFVTVGATGADYTSLNLAIDYVAAKGGGTIMFLDDMYTYATGGLAKNVSNITFVGKSGDWNGAGTLIFWNSGAGAWTGYNVTFRNLVVRARPGSSGSLLTATSSAHYMFDNCQLVIDGSTSPSLATSLLNCNTQIVRIYCRNTSMTKSAPGNRTIFTNDTLATIFGLDKTNISAVAPSVVNVDSSSILQWGTATTLTRIDKASLQLNDSGVAGTTTADALDNLKAAIPAPSEKFTHVFTTDEITAKKIVFADISRNDPESINNFIAGFTTGPLVSGVDFILSLGASLEFNWEGYNLETVIVAGAAISFDYAY